MIKKCKLCGKVLSGRQMKFCSPHCRSKHWTTNFKGFEFECERCGKKFRRERRSNERYTIRFCSRICANYVSGKERIVQKTRHGSTGYISVYCPDHPNQYGGRVREHILVVEKEIGRYIRKGEIVHHINYIEDDNRPENLILCRNTVEHCAIHKKTRFLIKEFIRKRRLNEELTNYIRNNCDVFSS